MERAIEAYRSITVSPEFREIERLRSKALHDEAQALSHAHKVGEQKGLQKGLQQGMLEVAGNLLRAGDSPEKVAGVTGLTLAEVEDLRNAL
jgi:predicted transposase/invertase (TIGR01784 family)